jgi:hypothetical protein
MAEKQTSVFGPFTITAIGGITLGLIVMYFGYYQTRISSYEQYIVEIQSKPTPEISFTFTVKDTTQPTTLFNREMGEDQGTPGETVPAADNPAMEASGQVNASRTPSIPARTACGRSPSRRKSSTDPSTDATGSQYQARGPAYPKTQPRSSEDDHYYDNEEPVEPPPYIPDINDPEMDDNPLIRALREASRRQAENPQDHDYGDESTPRNPFETILNIRSD